jgi:hypothetical protein
MSSDERYLGKRTAFVERHRILYFVQAERNSDKALEWANHLGKWFDKYAHEAYKEAKKSLDTTDVPELFDNIFPLGVMLEPEEVVRLSMDEDSALHDILTQAIESAKVEAENLIAEIVGMFILEHPELLLDIKN